MNERILERIARYGERSNDLSDRAECLREWAHDESDGSREEYESLLQRKGFFEMSEESTVWNVRKFVLELGFDRAHGDAKKMIEFFEGRIRYNFDRLGTFDPSDFGRLQFKYAKAEIDECNEAIAILSSETGKSETDWEKISQLSYADKKKILLPKSKRRQAARMIIEAEETALHYGIFSQIWIDARDGEIWETNYSKGAVDYQSDDAQQNYICLWRAEKIHSREDIEDMKSKPPYDPKYSVDEFENWIEKYLTENFLQMILWI